jgi:crotonobetainyl-CoA:carnitine CoA-transferase CaiB-like acyl-CoA transferase
MQNGDTLFQNALGVVPIHETKRMNARNRPQIEPGPFKLVVLETCGSIAAAFACSMLADFGARVFVCEEPPSGSRIRSLGGPAVRNVWWKIIARNKYSVAVDPAHPAASAVLDSLMDLADLVFIDSGGHPQSAAIWGTVALRKERRPLVVDIFPTGTDRRDLWPWGTHPALTAAATGMMALTGWPGQQPVQPEFPLAEYLSGILAASHALAELRRSGLAGEPPQAIATALHEAVQRMIEWQVPVATALGRPELRNGNSFPMAAGISNIYRTKDGRYVVPSAATQSTALRLLEMVGGRAMRNEPRYATPESRRQCMKEIDAAINSWMLERTLDEILNAAKTYDVVIGPVFDTSDVLADGHFTARNNIVRFRDDDGTAVPMPNIVPRISDVQTGILHLGPRLGADTDLLLQEAGFSAREVETFRASRVIWI